MLLDRIYFVCTLLYQITNWTTLTWMTACFIYLFYYFQKNVLFIYFYQDCSWIVIHIQSQLGFLMLNRCNFEQRIQQGIGYSYCRGACSSSRWVSSTNGKIWHGGTHHKHFCSWWVLKFIAEIIQFIIILWYLNTSNKYSDYQHSVPPWRSCTRRWNHMSMDFVCSCWLSAISRSLGTTRENSPLRL